MESNTPDNPFESPSAASNPGVNTELIIRRVSMAWLLPAIGIAMVPIVVACHMFATYSSLAIMLICAILFTMAAGLAMTLYGLLMIGAAPKVATHLLIGITTQVLLLLTIFGGIAFVMFSVW